MIKLSLCKATFTTIGALGLCFAALLPAESAHAINPVDCNQDDFLKVEYHFDTESDVHYECLANSGEYPLQDTCLDCKIWLTHIWTGNNRVQWFGDGRWQPDAGWIEKWTDFSWPNHPGGVKVNKLRIE